MTLLSVFAPRRFGRLIASDAMNVSRDPMLIFACVLSVLPALGLSMGSATLDTAGAAARIPDLHSYLVPVALLLPAFLIGWVSGFLLLEDRDDGPLMAVEVTPVGKAGFLGYRLAVSAAITALITVLGIMLLLPEASGWLKLVLLLTVPADTVLAAIALLAFARNKVEGLALTKLTNLAAIVPLAAVVPSPCGWSPVSFQLTGLGSSWACPVKPPYLPLSPWRCCSRPTSSPALSDWACSEGALDRVAAAGADVGRIHDIGPLNLRDGDRSQVGFGGSRSLPQAFKQRHRGARKSWRFDTLVQSSLSLAGRDPSQQRQSRRSRKAFP